MITIVGAGPAGLTLAYYLQQRRVPYVVLERHTVGYSWQNHYDSLHLHTLKQNSALPGLPMPSYYPAFPDKGQVAAYLQWYADMHGLHVQQRVKVEQAARVDGQWRLQTSQGEMPADTLVLATGIWATPVWAQFPGQTAFRGQIVHAQQYRNPSSFHGQRVLVVGAGNTGTEIAAELGNAGISTGIVVRDGVYFVPHPNNALAMDLAAWFTRTAPASLTNGVLRRIRADTSNIGIPQPAVPPLQVYPVVGFALPQAIDAGSVTLHGAIETLLPHGVRFADGREAIYDTLLLATGYRATIDFVQPPLRLDNEQPLADAAHAHAHLYTIGFDYPCTEGWLQSIGRRARYVLRQMVADGRLG